MSPLIAAPEILPGVEIVASFVSAIAAVGEMSAFVTVAGTSVGDAALLSLAGVTTSPDVKV
jgi:hypothetical protein